MYRLIYGAGFLVMMFWLVAFLPVFAFFATIAGVFLIAALLV
jgi:hypothetical protein